MKEIGGKKMKIFVAEIGGVPALAAPGHAHFGCCASFWTPAAKRGSVQSADRCPKSAQSREKLGTGRAASAMEI
jgi:hypothetical protein